MLEACLAMREGLIMEITFHEKKFIKKKQTEKHKKTLFIWEKTVKTLLLLREGHYQKEKKSLFQDYHSRI